MKKKIVFISTAIIATVILSMNACKKDDTTAPVITIAGNSAIDLPLNSTYNDQGASASDDVDGTITVTTVNEVNKDKTGTYTVTYSATDKAGNVANATRTVTVFNEAEIFAGSYTHCVDTCILTPPSSFVDPATVTVSDSVNKLVIINNFGAFGTNINIYATISGNTTGSAISFATGQPLGNNATITTCFTDSSNVISGNVSSTSFQIKYGWNDGTASDVCHTYYIR